MLWVVIPILLVDKLDEIPKIQVETWEEGVAPEKVPVSDWYLVGIEGPPYRNNSRDHVNIETIIGWLSGVLI